MDCPKKEGMSGMANKIKTHFPKMKVGPAWQIKLKDNGIKAQLN